MNMHYFLYISPFNIMYYYIFKVDLADWQKIKRESNLEPNEMRADLKKKGMLPPRTFEEKQLLITSTGI